MSNIIQNDHWFEFGTNDVVKSNDYGVWIDGSQMYASPKRDITYIEIPGRSGSYVMDNKRWQNIDIVYPCFISSDFVTRFNNFKTAMLKLAGTYQKLQDSLYSGLLGWYRVGVFDGNIEPDITGAFNQSGTFEITFHCQPQKWLNGGTGTISTSGTIINLSRFPSNPVLTVYGTGSVTVNNTTFTIANDSPFTAITVNCETYDCYAEGQNANMYVSLPDGFPVMIPGTNTITLSNTVTKIEYDTRGYSL